MNNALVLGVNIKTDSRFKFKMLYTRRWVRQMNNDRNEDFHCSVLGKLVINVLFKHDDVGILNRKMSTILIPNFEARIQCRLLRNYHPVLNL